MKIDSIIEEIIDTTDSLIIITNKDTIDYFFEDINDKVKGSEFSIFNSPNLNKKVKILFRDGVTVHFIDEEHIHQEIFYSSIEDITI